MVGQALYVFYVSTHIPGWDLSKHLIVTDEWRVHSHTIDHKEIRVSQHDANDDTTLTRLKGVFGGLDVNSPDLPGNFDSRLGLGDKYDKETFTIEPSDGSTDSLTKKTPKAKSLSGLGSKLSLGSKTLLGTKHTFTTKLLGSVKLPPDGGNKHPADTKKNSLNKKDLQDDKPESIKTNKKADKQDLELKSEATPPPMKSSKPKKKDDGNLKD